MSYWIIDPSSGEAKLVEDTGGIQGPVAPGAGGDPTGDVSVDNPSGDELDAAYAAAEAAAAPGPVSSPGQVEADSDLPSTGTGQGGSVAVSSSGTPVKAQKKFRNDVDRDFAAIDADAEAQLAEDVKRTRGAYGEAANVIAKPEEIMDAPSLYAAERDKITKQGQLDAMLSDMNVRFAQEEQQAQVAAVSVTQKAKADYIGQVKAYQAMSVDPGKLWGNLSPTMQKGALFSVFAHNFLGAQGIQTSAMDTLNRAIEQNIDAQVANINKQGQVAEHFRSLYDMTERESATAEEQRSRLRGFYYAAAEKQILAELAQYDAPIAQARAAEAVANLRIAREKEVQNLEDRWINRVQQAKVLYLQRRGMELDAAYKQQMYRLAVREQNFKEDQAKQKAAVYAPVWTNPVTKKGGGVFKGWVTDAQKAEVSERTGFYRTTAQSASELKKLIRKYGSIVDWGKWSGKVQGEDKERIRILAIETAYNLAYAKSGKQTAEKELEAFKDMFQPNKTFNWGNGLKILSDRVKTLDREFANYVEQFVEEPKTQEEFDQVEAHRPMSGFSVAGPEGVEADVDLGEGLDYRSAADEAIKKASRPDAGKSSAFADDDPIFSEKDQAKAVELGIANRYEYDDKGFTSAKKWVSELAYAADQAVKTADKAEIGEALKRFSVMATGTEPADVQEAINNLNDVDLVRNPEDNDRSAWAEYLIYEKLIPAYKD